MIDSVVLRAIWIASAAIVFVILLILLYLIERKFLRARHRAQVEEAIGQLSSPDSPLGEYLRSGERTRSLYASGAGLRREALEEALLDRLAVSASESERERIYVFAADYFAEEYAHLLTRRRWSDRMNALLHIEKFRIRELKDSLLRRLGELGPGAEADDERFLIVRSLSSLQLEETFDHLQLAADRFSELQLLQVLRPLRGELAARLIADFDELPIRIRRSVLDTLRLGNIRTAEVLALLERCMVSEDNETRIRALKALANFGYMTEEAADRLEARMAGGENVAWPERMMQARLAGAVREERFAAHLERLMADPSYEVRREAAAALSAYRSGLERIRRVADEHPDRFARDMAVETLERRAYERNVG
ncbi:HEAT repeat domain-containing protein [Saccharibacillus brassicae]|uniref:HEAT repeat domain-containing protein n=1 Tax=Saccharibacillus brassicae TaxID=2583377 RepID=A0A4Y6UVI6_SACBS|nr:HEAT repeat domain-containing protein [Saccharibacillus brassicae]QDH21752.1 HEAT repeat domain-containing protein [Saccharibacillus brassicae]